MRIRLIACLVILSGFVYGPVHGKETELSGTILIAGNGPERYAFELLADAFERLHPLVSVDFFWHPNAKPAKMVQQDEADLGVTGKTFSGLQSVAIGRDGIAILTNFSNPLENITTSQLRDIFTGKLKFWSQIEEEEPERRIIIIHRSSHLHIRQGLEDALRINGDLIRSQKIVKSERQALNEATGILDAMTYISITPALRAKEDGIPVNLLFMDGIEPEYQTMLSGRYPLQRKIFVVFKSNRSSLVDAFVNFCLSETGQRLVREGKFFPIEDQ